MNRARPPTILIVTSGLLCRNPRVLKEATTLGENGYDVTVLAIANVGRYEAYDREIMKTAPFRRETVDHISSDWRTRLTALRSRAGTWLARRSLSWGWERESALGPIRELRQKAEAHRADLTIVHTEQGFAVGAALLAQGRRVAADFEDWHSRDLLPADQRGRPLRLLRRCEQELLRRAAYSTTTSDAMADALAQAYSGPRPAVLRNVFPLQPDPRSGPGSPVPSFFWFSQTIGPGRMLELFLAAWRQTERPSRLCLLGDASSAYRKKLESRVPPRQRSALEFLPIVSPAELPSLIARHDLGLALEPSVPDNKNFTISNKIFQYLNAGLGVLATPTVGQREVLDSAPGAGEILDLTQTTALARRLDALLADAPGRIGMGAAARRAAEARFCWEKAAPVLLDAVARALHSPAP